MSGFAPAGRSHDVSHAPPGAARSDVHVPERTPAEKADDAVVGFERDVGVVEDALGAIAKAQQANDPAAWQQANDRVGSALASAEKTLQRARALVDKATPDAKKRLAQAEQTLADQKNLAAKPGRAPNGWDEVSRETAILAVLNAPVDGSLQAGFAKTQAAWASFT